MIYDAIVLGATYLAAGVASELGEKCLILERRPQAGYEFINALHFGSGYDKPLSCEETKSLYSKFSEKGAFDDGRVNLFGCAGFLYQKLEERNVLLNVEIISIERVCEVFEVVIHGVSGYRTFRAKKVIDTTVHNEMVQSKTLNLIVSSKTGAEADLKTEEPWGYPGDVLVKLPVDADADYIKARKQVDAFLKKLPSGYKAAVVADSFAYAVKEAYVKEQGGIFCLPSVAFENPLLAYEAGIELVRGGMVL